MTAMTARTAVKTTTYLAGGAALAALGYAALAGAAWTRYGHATRARRTDEEDPLLDGFMPLYDIVERHHITVEAPAAITLAAARDLDMHDSCVARTLFKGRELMLGGEPPAEPIEKGLIAGALALGWGVLADKEHEIVLGAVTRPWEANPAFRDLLPRDFARFAEPGYVKIAWTLRADTVDETRSIFRTETRAIATDMEARARFRKYWALVSPGVALIRYAMLIPVKAQAERRVVMPEPVLEGAAI
jgi:hypothetical protein